MLAVDLEGEGGWLAEEANTLRGWGRCQWSP